MSPATLLRLAAIGDILTVTFDGGSRTVTVTGRDAERIYTTSGKVRPGRYSGGMLRAWDDEVVYSPTLAQQARRVTRLDRAIPMRAA